MRATYRTTPAPGRDAAQDQAVDTAGGTADRAVTGARVARRLTPVALALTIGLAGALPAAAAQAPAEAPGGANPAPTPGITAPVGPGHRGGAQLDQTGVILYDRPAGVPRPPGFPAGAYLVGDLNSGDVLLAFNAHVQSLPASTMKTLTALALVPELDPATVVQATPEDANVDGTKVGMDPGASYTVDQLFHALMMSSANDAAVALARAGGGLPATTQKMNAVAARIGAVDTVAKNTSGLDAPGQVTTAYDLALIGRAALADDKIAKLVTTRTADFPSGRTKQGQTRPNYQISSHNKLLWNYDGTIGVKNGYTIKARQTYVGAARRGDQAYVVTYLAGEGTDWRTTGALLDWAFAYGPKLKAVGTLNQPQPQASPADSSGATALLAADPQRAVTATVSQMSPASRGAVIAGAAVAALLGAVVALRVRAVRRMRRRVARPQPRRTHTTV